MRCYEGEARCQQNADPMDAIPLPLPLSLSLSLPLPLPLPVPLPLPPQPPAFAVRRWPSGRPRGSGRY